jgi:hypothetical protein
MSRNNKSTRYAANLQTTQTPESAIARKYRGKASVNPGAKEFEGNKRSRRVQQIDAKGRTDERGWPSDLKGQRQSASNKSATNSICNEANSGTMTNKGTKTQAAAAIPGRFIRCATAATAPSKNSGKAKKHCGKGR